ncbi:MAG TPA: thioesterase family protein [Membranihabitans sp.]|nr:thioesterase family protein [Membranihabitans sp.]
MKPFRQRFEIRWSDLDANRHVANSAYVNFMSHTRMAYLISHGFDHHDMEKFRIGPVLFYEHIYYHREVLPGQTIDVTLWLKGLSKDGMFFEFGHEIFGIDGTHHLSAEIMGGFIDLDTRKLTPLADDQIRQIFDNLKRTPDFRWLTREDTRKGPMAQRG